MLLLYTSHKKCQQLPTLLILYNVVTCCVRLHVGETKRRLKDRFYKHRGPVDRPYAKSSPIHFKSSSYHSASNILVIPSAQIFFNLKKHTIA